MDPRVATVVLVPLLGVAAALLTTAVGRFVKIPLVVFEIVLGLVIGPSVLGWVPETDELNALANFGLAFLFFMAGNEIDFAAIGARRLRKASLLWVVSLAAGILLAALIAGDAIRGVYLGIALTSTSLVTLMPVLRDAGEMHTPFGRAVTAVGAVGEFGPILAMSIFLTQGSAWGGLSALLAFGVIAAGLGFLLVRHSPRAERIVDVIRRGADTTAQAPVRLMVLLLAVMLATSSSLGLDVILGAFVAGAIVRMLLPPDQEEALSRLDGVGYGFLIPVFFVVSGMGIDPAVFVERPGTVLFVFVSILLVRGGPVYLLNRRLPGRERLQLSLFSATGLPIIVAVTTVAVASGEMSHRGQSIVVAAGMLTVLVLPMLAVTLHRSEAAGVGSR